MKNHLNFFSAFRLKGCIVGFTVILLTPFLKAQTTELTWPQETNVTKPWVFWHWMGNAVDKVNIASELTKLNQAGIGGVLNVQLLDCGDPKAVKVPYLSAQWVDIMKFTINQARTLGMDMDMCATSGWEWGGPWITSADAGSKKNIVTFTLAAGDKLASPVFSSFKDLQAVMGFSTDGQKLDLTDRVNTACSLNWTAPADHGSWTIYAAGISRGSCMVRFPTPDATGFVVNYLDSGAVKRHLDKFATAFAQFSQNEWPRAWFDDSWEADMDWSDKSFSEFQKRRGYDLRFFLPELNGKGTADNNARVKRDIMLTVSEMMIDGFFKASTDWSKSHHTQLSCESIDHPGNTVDMAAATDIPVADIGGGADWWLPGGQFASSGDFFSRIKVQTSAAHIMGKPLIASETMSCWGLTTNCESNFKVTLKDIKVKIDLDLTGGINHTMIHSITYSPTGVQWPGYMFSAETQCGPYNPYWSHFTELNKYISRSQSFLQTGTSDIDLLFYYPCDDMFMHGNSDHLYFSPIAKQLFENGYDLDYITDKMLLNPDVVSTSNKVLVSPGSTHKAIVIANCTFMEDTTLQRIFNLAYDGASVVVVGDFPADVPGLNNLNGRRAKLNALISSFNSSKVTTGTIEKMATGSGQILKGTVLSDLMMSVVVNREKMVDYGLRYTRRKDANGWIYFISNPPGNAAVNAWIPLGVTGSSAALFDPMTGKTGMAGYSNSRICLQLEPAGSIIVKVFDHEVTGPAWVYQYLSQPATPITGTWKVEFLSGGETMPTTENVSILSSWTAWTSSPQINILRYFSGVARYSITFDKPQTIAGEWFIDLGDVGSSAKVTLNGTYLGMVCGAPNYRVNTNGLLKPTGNQLEVEVANLATNREAYLDLNGISWRFSDGPSWSTAPMVTSGFVPLKSGLLGPVRLVPSTNTIPQETVDQTQIIITADNGYSVYQNGTLLGSGSNWNGTKRYPLAFVAGENVIAVRGSNTAGSPGGLLASVMHNDSCIALTNSTWKVSTSAPVNWNKVGFNDSAWANATDYGAYGVSPWNYGISGMTTETIPHWIWSKSMNDTNPYFRLTFSTISTAVIEIPQSLIRFRFAVNGSENVLGVDVQEVSHIRIFDLWGRLIHNIAVAPNTSRVVWNRENDRGALAANGVYLVQFQGKSMEKTMKIII